MAIEVVLFGLFFILMGAFCLAFPMLPMGVSGIEWMENPRRAKEKQVLNAWFAGLSFIAIGLFVLVRAFT